MNEIETKILDIDRVKVENKLIKLGAKKIFEGELKAVFFDKDNEIKGNYKVFRLRQEGNEVKLTHKTPEKKQGIAKVAKEIEISVSNFDVTKEMLEALGYKIFQKARKIRTSYKLNNVRIEFDNLLDDDNFIPEFIELESDNLDDIYELVTKLNFKKKDCKNWGFHELVNYYKNL